MMINSILNLLLLKLLHSNIFCYYYSIMIKFSLMLDFQIRLIDLTMHFIEIHLTREDNLLSILLFRLGFFYFSLMFYGLFMRLMYANENVQPEVTILKTFLFQCNLIIQFDPYISDQKFSKSITKLTILFWNFHFMIKLMLLISLRDYVHQVFMQQA